MSTPTPKGSVRWKNGAKYRVNGKRRDPNGGVLNERMRKAVDEYFANGGQIGKAMLAAGYSKTTATNCTHSVFSHPAVVREIRRRQAYLLEQSQITEKWVIERLAKIANAGMVLAPYRKINKQGELYYDFKNATPEELAVVTEISTDTYTEGRGPSAREIKKMKIGISDPKAALDSLARILGLNKDNLKVSGEVSLVERLQAGRKRAAAKS